MRRKRARKDALGWVLILATFALLTAMGVAAAMLRPPPTDPETLCRTDRPLAAHTLILVDATDKLEPRHKKRLRAAVETERARLKPYDRLTLAALRVDRPREPRILFSLCNPGDGSLVNPLFENARMAQQRWEEAFGAPLDAALKRAGGGRAGAASPITESIAALAADPDFAPAIQARRLVLVSDLMEHETGGFTLYRDGARFEDYRAAGAAAPDLAGVSVRVVPLDRPEQSARQSAGRGGFWEPYFAAAGADDVSWDPSL